MLPHDLPNWQTVYTYYRNWRLDGTWERIHHALRKELREEQGVRLKPVQEFWIARVSRRPKRGAAWLRYGQFSFELQRYRQQARDNLLSEQGIALRELRNIEVESVLGDIKHNMDLRRFMLHGLKKRRLSGGCSVWPKIYENWRSNDRQFYYLLLILPV